MCNHTTTSFVYCNNAKGAKGNNLLRREGEEKKRVPSRTAAQGQWVKGTEPEHTCRAGGIVQLTVIVPLWSPYENMFPDNVDWLHEPDSNHNLDSLHRRGKRLQRTVTA